MITKQEIENIALLSKLQVTEDEIERFAEELEKMVEFAQAVSSAEVENYEDREDISKSDVYREDVIVPSLSSAQILSNAPEVFDSHFLLRKRV